MGYKRARAKDYLTSFNEEGIDKDIREQRALPDLIFKYGIFKAQEEMIQAKMDMKFNKRAHFTADAPRGAMRVNPQDLHTLASKIDGLFSRLKFMIAEKMKEITLESDRFKYNERLFLKLCELQSGKLRYTEQDLLELEDFLCRYMHDLNLTNLLRKESDPYTDMESNW